MPSGRISVAASRKPAAQAPAARRSGSWWGSVSPQVPSASTRLAAIGASGINLVRRSLIVTTPSRTTRDASSSAAAISLRAPWRRTSPLRRGCSARSNPFSHGGASPADRAADPARALHAGGRPGAAAHAERGEHDWNDQYPDHDDGPVQPRLPPTHEDRRWEERQRKEAVPSGPRRCRRSVHAARPLQLPDADRDPGVRPDRLRDLRRPGTLRATRRNARDLRDPVRRLGQAQPDRKAGGPDRDRAGRREETAEEEEEALGLQLARDQLQLEQ